MTTFVVENSNEIVNTLTIRKQVETHYRNINPLYDIIRCQEQVETLFRSFNSLWYFSVLIKLLKSLLWKLL